MAAELTTHRGYPKHNPAGSGRGHSRHGTRMGRKAEQLPLSPHVVFVTSV